ncbi:Uncharacterised protein [Vibrio cholerae]|nr:Uncharacterised protein [Vibrio cholerae]
MGVKPDQHIENCVELDRLLSKPNGLPHTQ